MEYSSSSIGGGMGGGVEDCVAMFGPGDWTVNTGADGSI